MTKLSLARPGAGVKPSKVNRPQTPADAVKIPRDLSADERFIWRRWAPRAMSEIGR